LQVAGLVDLEHYYKRDQTDNYGTGKSHGRLKGAIMYTHSS